MATHQVELINHHDLMPGLKMISCGARPDATHDQQNHDCAIYRAEDAPAVDNAPHWADQLIPVIFKASNDSSLQDAYAEDGDGVQAGEADLCRKTRDQLMSHAELLFAAQQRLVVFILLVIGRTARFIRSDRSSTEETVDIDYYLDWEPFVNILWRIAHCSRPVLGLDPTARRLSPADPLYALMTGFAAPREGDVDHRERILHRHEVPKQPFVFQYVRKSFGESLDSNWPRYCVEVPDGDKRRQFLICKPHFRAKGLSGRGTRGYVALDCETKRFVWLKDAWRTHDLLVDREGDILQRLKEAKVPRVPTLVCHGDIDNQVTLTRHCGEDSDTNLGSNQEPGSPPSSPHHKLSSTEAIAGHHASTSKKRKFPDDEEDAGAAPPAEGPNTQSPPHVGRSRHYKHYRLVVEEVALPLSEFQSGKQLIQVVRDCVLAHFRATTDAKLLHCDISTGNLLIYPKIMRVRETDGTRKGRLRMKYTGLLADWEMAKPIDQRQPKHTGSWEFMSAALSCGLKDAEVCDEIESFYYVLLYQAVRYLQSNFDCPTVENYIIDFFDDYAYVN
ncbi:hypothetical protein K466DRAFT_500245, partial [Polyporus arcularius HHB13444]